MTFKNYINEVEIIKIDRNRDVSDDLTDSMLKELGMHLFPKKRKDWVLRISGTNPVLIKPTKKDYPYAVVYFKNIGKTSVSIDNAKVCQKDGEREWEVSTFDSYDTKKATELDELQDSIERSLFDDEFREEIRIDDTPLTFLSKGTSLFLSTAIGFDSIHKVHGFVSVTKGSSKQVGNNVEIYIESQTPYYMDNETGQEKHSDSLRKNSIKYMKKYLIDTLGTKNIKIILR